MLIRIARAEYFKTSNEAVLYHLARLALSDRKWYLDNNNPAYLYIPVGQNEKHIIKLLTTLLANSDTQYTHLTVIQVWAYADLLYNGDFIEFDPEFTLMSSGNEMVPYNVGVRIEDLKDYPELSFTKIPFEQFAEMNKALYLGKREYDLNTIAETVRSIIAPWIACSNSRSDDLAAVGYALTKDGELAPVHVDLVPLIVAARKSIPVIQMMNRADFSNYPIEVLPMLLDQYPRDIEQMADIDDNVFSKESSFIPFLKNAIVAISKMTITTVPAYLFEAALFYMHSVDPVFTRSIQDSVHNSEKPTTSPIFLSDADLEFQATVSAWIFKHLKCDTDSVYKMLTTAEIDYQTMYKSLEIASHIDKSGFFLFINRIQEMANKHQMDISFGLKSFLRDDKGLDDEAASITLDMISVQVHDTSEDEKEICNDAKINNGDGQTISVRQSVIRSFTFIDPNEVTTVTVRRGELSDAEKVARCGGYNGSDPYGIISMFSDAIRIYKESPAGDFSGFEKHGKALGKAMSQMTMDLGWEFARFIFRLLFDKTIVPNIAYVDIESVFNQYIYPNASSLIAPISLIMEDAYLQSMNAKHLDDALILYAARCCNYTKENEVLDQTRIVLSKLFGECDQNAKSSLYRLIAYLRENGELESTIKSAFEPGSHQFRYARICAHLGANNPDSKPYMESLSNVFMDAVMIAQWYLSTVHFSEDEDPRMHAVITSIPLNQDRLNKMDFLPGTVNYPEEVILYLSAWSYDEINVKFRPVLNSLRAATKKMLVEAGESEDSITYDPTVCAGRFDLMNENIGIESILEHLELERDNDGVPFNCIENLLRAIAYHNLSREGALSKEDAAYLDDMFCEVEIDEFTSIVQGLEMLCAIS